MALPLDDTIAAPAFYADTVHGQVHGAMARIRYGLLGGKESKSRA
jgi:hypothetical protein